MADPTRALLWQRTLTLDSGKHGNGQQPMSRTGSQQEASPACRLPVFQPSWLGGYPKRQPKARFVRARQGCELQAHRLEAIERTRRSFSRTSWPVERVKLRWHWPPRRQSNLAHSPPLRRGTAGLASRSLFALDFFSEDHLACGAKARTGARHSGGPGHMQVNYAHFRSLASGGSTNQPASSPDRGAMPPFLVGATPPVNCIPPARGQARPWRQEQVHPDRGQ